MLKLSYSSHSFRFLVLNVMGVGGTPGSLSTFAHVSFINNGVYYRWSLLWNEGLFCYLLITVLCRFAFLFKILSVLSNYIFIDTEVLVELLNEFWNLFPLKVFCKWRKIAKIMRQSVFDENMEEEIDIFHLEVCLCFCWALFQLNLKQKTILLLNRS